MKAPKDRSIHRLKIIQGQLKGLEKMINEDKYCVNVLTLSLAIQKALKEFDQLVMESHMKGCVKEGVTSGKPEKVTKELMELFALIRK
ncbi:MAG: metal-sensitive transcriptional regulator [bacterium]|nr:metal-sensitive transcriptional regulator [bacterium]